MNTCDNSQGLKFSDRFGSLVDPEERMHDFEAETFVLGSHLRGAEDIRLDLFDEDDV